MVQGAVGNCTDLNLQERFCAELSLVIARTNRVAANNDKYDAIHLLFIGLPAGLARNWKRVQKGTLPLEMRSDNQL